MKERLCRVTGIHLVVHSASPSFVQRISTVRGSEWSERAIGEIRPETTTAYRIPLSSYCINCKHFFRSARNNSQNMTENNQWAQLVCISEEDGLVIPISSDTFSIGRARSCDLSMPDNKFISGRHCCFSKQNNTVWLEDCSSNGTWLNGVKIGKGQKQRLCHGDNVAIVYQEGPKSTENIVYRFDDCAMLEALKEELDQTQTLDDPDENTEDYIFEDQEEGDSRKRKNEVCVDEDEPAQKRKDARESEGREDVDQPSVSQEKTDKKAKNDPSKQKTKISDIAADKDSSKVKDDAKIVEEGNDGEKGESKDQKEEAEIVKEGNNGEKGESKNHKEEAKAGAEEESKPTEEAAKLTEDEPDPILETLICSICQDILHKCVSLQPCMHSFCAACISGWLKHSKKCPQCRNDVGKVGHNYIVNSLVDAYLKQRPDKQRLEEELKEMDEHNNVPFNQTINYDAIDYDDEDDEDDEDYNNPDDPDDEDDVDYNDEAGSEDVDLDEGLDEDHRLKCRQCPSYVQPLNGNIVAIMTAALGGASSSTATTSAAGDSSSTSATTTPSSSGRVKTAAGGIAVPLPDPPQFQCDPHNVNHVLCVCCRELMPVRPEGPDIPPQKCRACKQYYCHMYWGCYNCTCLGCLNYFKDMRFNESVLDTIINQNRYESTIFKNIMRLEGADTVQRVLRKALDRLDAGLSSTQETLQHGLGSNAAVCYLCSLEVFQKLAYQLRARIPRDELPAHVAARPDCYWGDKCRTQYNNPRHAANFNHICNQTRF